MVSNSLACISDCKLYLPEAGQRFRLDAGNVSRESMDER